MPMLTTDLIALIVCAPSQLGKRMAMVADVSFLQLAQGLVADLDILRSSPGEPAPATFDSRTPGPLEPPLTQISSRLAAGQTSTTAGGHQR